MSSAATRTVTDQDYTSGAIGNADDTPNNVTDLKKAQFGVFGYYTQTKNYRESTTTWGSGTWKTDASTANYPNFMYNEHLQWSTSNPIDMWIYSPVKYWPNGIDAANVADSPSNTAGQNDLANLTFFAYAPYMEEGTTATTGSDIPASVTANNVSTPLTIDHDNDNSTAEVNNGIVAISSNTSPTDVWVKYVLPVAEENKAVDLLWGLRGQKSYSEADGSNDVVDALGNYYNENLTKQTVDERVRFLFKHALAKIGGTKSTSTESLAGDPSQCGFKVVVDIDKNSDSPTTTGQSDQTSYFANDFSNATTLVTLKEVKIQDGYSAGQDANVYTVANSTESNLLKSGWFDIETGTWSTTNAETGGTYNITANNTNTSLTDATYTLNAKIKEIGAKKNGVTGDGKELQSGNASWDTSANPVGVTLTPTDVFCNENVPGLMLIPGGTATIYVTVTYVVRTADPKLNAGYSEVEQTITNAVSLASLESNKYYTIIMHLGLTSVKFEAVVADWVSNDGTTFNEDGTAIDPTTPTENREVIWLPSNVVTSQNISLSLAADATAATVTLNSMTAGAYTSDNTSVIANGTATGGTNTLNITLTANSTSSPVTTTVKITDADSKVYTIKITQAAGS